VNARVGKEGEFRLQPSARAKRIMVVGSGPAGMEAAMIASLRGHQVTLYEKERWLGGSLVFAATVRSENEHLLHYFETQIRKLPIKIRLGEEVTPTLVEQIKPDATILALGVSLITPQIPGVDAGSVISGADLRRMAGGHFRQSGGGKKLPTWQRVVLYVGRVLPHRFKKPSTLRRLTRLWMPLGKRVTIIGGDLVGCELAQFLVERGRNVTIVDSRKSMAIDMPMPLRWRTIDYLRQKGVVMLTGVKYEAITNKGMILTTKEGERETVEADTTVLAGEAQPSRELFQAIEHGVPHVYLAGDCSEVRLIRGAIADGTRIALTI
jgi:NADPH-dependent 2,4-dienoyl-CoA reductase/sulfur reductase-like enzyme